MQVVCLDLEGVLIPEMWLAVAESTGIEGLRLTTRDVADYDLLMKKRIAALEEHGVTLPKMQEIIDHVEPLEGAMEFLEFLRSRTQVVILSDTFRQFARPIMRKLGWPTLFCNDLVLAGNGSVVDYRLRQEDGKASAVRAFRSIGLEVIASGDSYNDIGMLKAANHGVLFRPPAHIEAEYADFPSFTEYTDFIDYLGTKLDP